MTLKEIRECSLDILIFIDKVCKEQNLKYYLAAGTLLGAIRHKGFIPWDDDIDIMMPREDYEKLIQIFPKNTKYDFLTFHNTPNIPYAFGKIIDSRTIKNEPLRRKYQVIGVDIDVFPIDNYPDNLEEAKVWCNKIKKVQHKIASIISECTKRNHIVHTFIISLYFSFNYFLDFIGITSVRKCILKLDSLANKYNNISTNYCGIAAIAAYGIKKRNRKIIFSESIEADFEGHKFPIPIGYDEYLTDYYGDYMKLPPIEKRKTHHDFIAYWK